MPNGVAKRDLPTKICAACGRPFAWRRKWARDWEQVLYCSDACRRQGATTHDTKAHGSTAQGEP